MELLEPEEADTFVRYSRCLVDLAVFFKLAKKNDPLSPNSTKLRRTISMVRSKQTMKKGQSDLCKMIFGVGNVPTVLRNESVNCRVVPTKLVGFCC